MDHREPADGEEPEGDDLDMTAAAAAAPVLMARSIGEALTLLRHRAGIGRDTAAQEAHVGEGTLSRYEHDQTAKPDLAAIRRVTQVLVGYSGDDMAEVWLEIGSLLDRHERITFAEAAASVHHLREPKAPKGRQDG